MKTLLRQALDQTQATIDRLRDNQFSVEDVRSLLAHPSILVRANALEALSRLAPEHPEAIADLTDAAQGPDSTARIIGIRLGYIAVASLLRTALPEAAAAAQQLIAAWPESDREDLLWYLEAERLWERPSRTAETSAATSAA